MSIFKILKQREAEKDEYLIECFHDAGFIHQLINSSFSIVSGRKGSGKTAIARYVENKYEDFGLDAVIRLSVRSISLGLEENKKDHVNSILFFTLIKVVQNFLQRGIFSGSAEIHWKDFLTNNGLQNVSDYETFFETKKHNKTGFTIKGLLSSLFAKVGGMVATEDGTSSSRTEISNTPSSLVEALKQSLPSGKDFLIFLDDITDYLDIADEKTIKEEISIIQDLLLKLEIYNSEFADSGKSLRFISLVREDLFEYLEGSNINKLKGNSLMLEWKEESFASVLIKRLPFYSDNLNESLEDPIEAIRRQFPDEIFASALEGFETNRYATNFYAYMVAVSFNRPRDFLMFCYAMRERLSMKHGVTYENIEAAEIEYSDYFTTELRDELFLASRLLGFKADQENVNRLIDILSRKNGFNSSELRTELGQYLGEKTSKLGRKKIEAFIEELWWYGILGFKEDKKQLINFRYVAGRTPFVVSKIKSYFLFLHRGLWWFSQKRKIDSDKT